MNNMEIVVRAEYPYNMYTRESILTDITDCANCIACYIGTYYNTNNIEQILSAVEDNGVVHYPFKVFTEDKNILNNIDYVCNHVSIFGINITTDKSLLEIFEDLNKTLKKDIRVLSGNTIVNITVRSDEGVVSISINSDSISLEQRIEKIQSLKQIFDDSENKEYYYNCIERMSQNYIDYNGHRDIV